MEKIPFSANWQVEASWAHPVWQWYSLLLVDLTTELPDQPKPNIFHPEATHELTVWALNPDSNDSYVGGKQLVGSDTYMAGMQNLLHGPNQVFQWRATNVEAEARVLKIYEAIRDGNLNPDTDANRSWVFLFHDWTSARNAV